MDKTDCWLCQGHTDQVYSMAWSGCGRFLATVCRDGKLRIFCPRQSSRPLREDGDIVATRVVWACEGKYLVTTGFSRQSERQIMVWQSKDLSCVHTETLDVSPAILIPFYDEDSSTLFVSGKGETSIYGYEIAEDAPHMFRLSQHNTSAPTQGLAFIAHTLNVREAEFARCYQLTNTGITPISWTVPGDQDDQQQHRREEAGAEDEDVNTGMFRLNVNVVPISSNFSFG